VLVPVVDLLPAGASGIARDVSLDLAHRSAETIVHGMEELWQFD
jgi:hypothetical protein